MTIGIDVVVLDLLRQGHYEEVPQALAQYEGFDQGNLSLGLDGVFVELDPSWPTGGEGGEEAPA